MLELRLDFSLYRVT